MADTFGLTFAPTASALQDDELRRRMWGSGVQQAIQMLSLRLPRVLGARTPSPEALLRSPGAAGGSLYGNPSALVQSILAQIIGRQGVSAPTQAAAPNTGASSLAAILGQPGGGAPNIFAPRQAPVPRVEYPTAPLPSPQTPKPRVEFTPIDPTQHPDYLRPGQLPAETRAEEFLFGARAGRRV